MGRFLIQLAIRAAIGMLPAFLAYRGRGSRQIHAFVGGTLFGLGALALIAALGALGGGGTLRFGHFFTQPFDFAAEPVFSSLFLILILSLATLAISVGWLILSQLKLSARYNVGRAAEDTCRLRRSGSFTGPR